MHRKRHLGAGRRLAARASTGAVHGLGQGELSKMSGVPMKKPTSSWGQLFQWVTGKPATVVIDGKVKKMTFAKYRGRGDVFFSDDPTNAHKHAILQQAIR